MALGQGVLAGKKTYVLAALGILGSIGSYLMGEMTLVQALMAIIGSGGLITSRIATKSEADKRYVQLDEIKSQLDKK